MNIQTLIDNYQKPHRIAISKRFPILKEPVIAIRHFLRNLQNALNPKIKYSQKTDFYDCVVARHQSVLRRKLGDSDPNLQEQKIINLRQAIKRLNGVVIYPNNIFSFWDIVGKPSYKNGYVDGMLLSNGEVIEGVGGGLCQLSNFLHWIFLHAPFEIVERHHHSIDVFPDSGRVLPFGAGATIFYNYIDLKAKNVSKYQLQLKLWLTDNHLKGQILSSMRVDEKFHIYEKNHCFVRASDKVFRYNEIYRQTKINGDLIKSEKIITNFAPVLYVVEKDRCVNGLSL